MALSWDHLGELASVAQLTGLDAGRLIGMIVQAAHTARMHKKNCQKFAQHLKLIGNLLDQLKISELKKYPETREPLEQLEDALRRAYVLVSSCQGRSYFYLLAMGWNIVYQFRRAQTEIDRYLKIVPLITLVDNARVREKIEHIERDECEYTFDEEDKKIQDVILSRNPSSHDTVILKKSLSCNYNMPFQKAIKKENEKLKLELQRSQSSMDVGQCEVIQHLLEVTEVVAKTSSHQSTQKAELKHSDSNMEAAHNFEGNAVKYCHEIPRCSSPVSPARVKVLNRGFHQHEEWNTDLLDCCSNPYLCMKTFFYPCGTFSKISTVANNRHISSAEACNDLMAYSLVLSCCCYTCCVRRKLRMLYNITGGLCDDFLSHLICCCCALVQEWREVEIREASSANGNQKTNMDPPPSQFMES